MFSRAMMMTIAMLFSVLGFADCLAPLSSGDHAAVRTLADSAFVDYRGQIFLVAPDKGWKDPVSWTISDESGRPIAKVHRIDGAGYNPLEGAEIFEINPPDISIGTLTSQADGSFMMRAGLKSRVIFDGSRVFDTTDTSSLGFARSSDGKTCSLAEASLAGFVTTMSFRACAMMFNP